MVFNFNLTYLLQLTSMEGCYGFPMHKEGNFNDWIRNSDLMIFGAQSAIEHK